MRTLGTASGGRSRPTLLRRVGLLPRWVCAIVVTPTLLGCDGCRSRPNAVPSTNHETSTAGPSFTEADDETVDAAPVSSPLPLPSRARLAASLSHTCVVVPTGRLLCWGSNGSGELGDGTRKSRSPNAPAEVPLEMVASVTVGIRFTCALKTDRTVWCWGSGPVGPAWGESLVPKQVLGLKGVRGLVAGGFVLCAMDSDDVRCWGRNHTTGSTAPPAFEAGDGPVSLGIGAVATMCPPRPEGVAFARKTGEVMLYEGSGKIRQLSSNAARPTQAALRAIRCSNFRRLWVLTADGVASLSEEPAGGGERQVSLLALPRIRSLGINHGELRSAVGVDGRLYAWGDNSFGERADGTAQDGSTVTVIDGLSDVSTAAILTGGGCAVAGRRLWCWGDDPPWAPPSKSLTEHVKVLW